MERMDGWRLGFGDVCMYEIHIIYMYIYIVKQKPPTGRKGG